MKMKLNAKGVVTAFAATGVAAGALAGGGVALASARTPAVAAASAVSATAAPLASRCPGHPDGMPGMHGRWSGQQPVIQAAAAYLRMSHAALREQLQAGNSLAGVARAQGKQVSGLKDAILAAITSRINASSGLTAAQKAAMLREVRSHLDEMVSTVRSAGAGMDQMNSPGGMGMWQ